MNSLLYADGGRKLLTTLEGVYCGVVMLVEVFVAVSGGCTFAAVTFPFGIRDMTATGRKHLCNVDNSDDKGANLPPHPTSC